MPPRDTNPLLLPAIGALAMTVSYFLGFAVRRLLNFWRIMDNPNERSSHVQPTPRGGGLGIIGVFLLGAVPVVWLTGSGPGLMAGGLAALLALVGFLDDRRPLPWWIRLGVYLIAAVAMSLPFLAGTGLVRFATLVGFSLLFAGYTNAFNFMDGINGLAAGQAVLSAAGLAAVALAAGVPATHPAVLLGVLLAGAAAGFLPHNFPAARMFMGDLGSVPLGFLLMTLTVWLAHDGGWWLLPPLAALHANFVMDTAITLVRRAGRRERLVAAHREHFYQRLVRAGWSHGAATGLEMAIAGVVLAVLLATIAFRPRFLPLAVALVPVVWAVFFVFCEREFRHRLREET